MTFSVINEEIVGYIIHYSNFNSEHLKSYNKLKTHSIRKSKSIQQKYTDNSDQKQSCKLENKSPKNIQMKLSY